MSTTSQRGTRGRGRGRQCGEVEAAPQRAGGDSDSVLRRWCSGGLGRGTGEWVRGMERGGPPGTGAHERREIGALPRAVHGGDDVAAGGALGARCRAGEDIARGVEGGGELKRDAWRSSASRRWPGRQPRAAGGAAQRRRPEEQSKQAGWRKGKRDQFAISEILGTQL